MDHFLYFTSRGRLFLERAGGFELRQAERVLGVIVSPPITAIPC
jgi:hypothetical protein